MHKLKLANKNDTDKTKSKLPGLPIFEIFVSVWIKTLHGDIPGRATKTNCDPINVVSIKRDIV